MLCKWAFCWRGIKSFVRCKQQAHVLRFFYTVILFLEWVIQRNYSCLESPVLPVVVA
jgi:hypothetical protein